MKRKEALVYAVYKDNPENVNSDKRLIPAVWRLEGWDDSRSLEENFARVSNPESITRARRKLHEDNLIEYSKEAEDTRYEQFKEAKEEYGHKVEVDEETNTVRFI